MRRLNCQQSPPSAPALSPSGENVNAATAPLAPEETARARDLISSASRPVILAGLGLEPEAPYDALRILAEAANAPVIVSPKRQRRVCRMITPSARAQSA